MTNTASTAPEAATLELLDPRSLLIERNVRREASADQTLVESVRDLGVLVPLVAVRGEEGVRVRYGQRRTLAAIEAKRPVVPVWVIDAERAGSEVDRIVAQWAENEHRENLSEADRLAAVEQLSAFGVSAAQITKRLKTRRAHVDAALTVAGSALARAAAERYDFLTLDQAAAVAEFDAAGDTETAKALLVAAQNGPGAFAHAAQRARDERAQAERERAAREAIAASGVPVLEGRCPGWGAAGTVARLSWLADEAGSVLTPAGHAVCPGHAAFLVVEYDYWTEEQAATVLLTDAAATPGTSDAGEVGEYAGGQGEQVDPQDVDPGDLDPEDYPAGDEDEEQEAAGRSWRGRYAAAYVCADYPAHGHIGQWGHTDSGGRATAPLSPAEEAAEKEAARAERRRVIEHNKAWRSAEQVRRDWLRTFLARKTPPTAAPVFLARRLASGTHQFTRAAQEGHSLACELFGVERRAGYYTSAPTGLWGLLESASDARAQVIALGLVLAAHEAATGTHSWRHVDPDTAAYLRFIVGHGYSLSAVERLACGETSPPGDEHSPEQGNQAEEAGEAEPADQDEPNQEPEEAAA